MSTLNPHAPEFFPTVASVSEHGYTAVSNGIRASNMLADLKESDTNSKIWQEMFNNFKCNLLNITNRILCLEDTTIKIKRCDEESSFDSLMEANAGILDLVDMEFELADRLDSRTFEKSSNVDFTKRACHISTWNAQPTLKTSRRMRDGTAIVKPQLQFKEKVNNSNKIFKPKIKNKPNAKKPLSLTLLHEDGEPVGYNHPYSFELLNYQPQEELLKNDLQLLDFPKSIEESDFTYVDNEEILKALIDDLSMAQEIAIDLEHHDFRSFLGFTCLIQISTTKADYIIDALALRHCLNSLNIIFTDPKKLKIIHGSTNDILWLQKDFGVYIVGLYDTYHAAKLLNFPYLSLKYLMKHYCNIDMNKAYQTADWRQRPLSEDLLKYAQMDTHYLIYIWRATKKDLLFKTGGIQNLHTVFCQSTDECLQKYNKPILSEKNLSNLMALFNITFNSSQLECLRRLYLWRDECARKEDESLMYVLPDYCMVKLAEVLPREKEGIVACCSSSMPPLVAQNLNAIQNIITECRQLPIQPTLFRVPQGIATVLNKEQRATLPVDETNTPEFSSLSSTIPTPFLIPGGCTNNNEQGNNFYNRQGRYEGVNLF